MYFSLYIVLNKNTHGRGKTHMAMADGKTPEGYISKDIISYPYIPKSPPKDISYHFLEKDILRRNFH
jgi:hypothetical protein